MYTASRLSSVHAHNSSSVLQSARHCSLRAVRRCERPGGCLALSAAHCRQHVGSSRTAYQSQRQVYAVLVVVVQVREGRTLSDWRQTQMVATTSSALPSSR